MSRLVVRRGCGCIGERRMCIIEQKLKVLRLILMRYCAVERLADVCGSGAAVKPGLGEKGRDSGEGCFT